MEVLCTQIIHEHKATDDFTVDTDDTVYYYLNQSFANLFKTSAEIMLTTISFVRILLKIILNS